MPTKEKIEALKQRKEKIEKQLTALQAREKSKERKEDTRLKMLVGAAILADCKINPSTIEFVKAILCRGITAERDKEFLRGKGWLPPGQ